MMEELLQNPYIIKSIKSLVVIVVIYILSKILIALSIRKRGRSTEAPYLIKYLAIAITTTGIAFIWLEGLGPLLTTLSIVAAALTIVSKEMILNLLGSAVIFWRELFSIGDRVQVGDHAGDVIDKGILYFTLLEVGQTQSTGHSTGRLIKIPNALTLTLPVINATRGAGYVWNEIHIALTRDSDFETSKTLLTSIVNEFYETEDISLDDVRRGFERKKVFFNKLTPKVYTSLCSGGIKLTLRYLSGSRLVRESEDYIVTAFLKQLPGRNIQLTDDQ